MSMVKSDVFEEFVKIAQEKGLISEGEHAEHTEKNLDDPRWDSLDLSAIEALYGVKPDKSKGMEYEHNIMEDAHPSSCVIAPSHDKLNGLVENELERQNITMHIVHKTPDGFLTQRKYAEKDLMMALVRVANDLDNKDKEELRLLADTCLGQLSRGFKKEAIIPYLVGIAAVLGITYAVEHLPDVDQGLKTNYERLQDELSDFAKADTTLGFGHKYDQALVQDVDQLQAKLSRFWSVYQSALPVIQAMERPAGAKEVISMVKDPKTMSIMHAYEILRAAAQEFGPYLKQIEKNFQNPDYKAEHTAEKGAVTSLVEKIPYFHGGNASLTADDFDDVVNAIPPFMDSVSRLLAVLGMSKSLEEKARTDLAAASSETQKWLGPDLYGEKSSPATGEIPTTVPPNEDEVDDLDKALSLSYPGFTN